MSKDQLDGLFAILAGQAGSGFAPDMDAIFPELQQAGALPVGAVLDRLFGLRGSPPQAACEEDPEKARSAKALANHLASKGFTVEQALNFYIHFQREGMMDETTTSAQVVRNIVIPQTADKRCCYMDSDFMAAAGGPTRAKRLVSHSWASPFVNALRNIVMDAGDLPADDPAFRRKHGPSGTTEPIPFNAEAVLRRFQGTDVLQKTYWMCIFGVNEHNSICGDCWSCRSTPAWAADPRRHLAADPCLICGDPKWNPCACGSVKLAPSDPGYEIDKFDLVVREMEALVVSLDSDMKTVTRMWVVAEIGEAVTSVPVYFRLANVLGDGPCRLLQDNHALVPGVALCDATSEEDKARILAKIERSPGGLEAYDAFVRFMLDMRFARCTRLLEVPKDADSALRKIQHACLDGSWHQKIVSVAEVLGSGREFRRLSLSKLDVSFGACKKLADVGELAEAVATQEGLVDLRLNFQCCNSLGSGGEAAGVDRLAAGLSKLSQLLKLEMVFQSTEVGDADAEAIGHNLPASLETLTLGFRDSKVGERSGVAIAGGLGPALRRLDLRFGDTQVGDAAAEAIGSKLPDGLEHLALSLGKGRQAAASAGDCGAAGLGAGLPGTLRSLTLDLQGWEVSDEGLEALARGLPPHLDELKLQLDWTKVGDPSAAALARNLPSGLQSLSLNLQGTQVTPAGQGVLVASLPLSLREVILDFTGKQAEKAVGVQARERLGPAAKINICREPF